MTVIEAPITWVRSVSELQLPARADRRLPQLMDDNNEGRLKPGELVELEWLVEVSQELSLVRAEALRLLGRSPGLHIDSVPAAPAIDIHLT